MKVQPLQNGIRGVVQVPGDKSISHRVLMFGSLHGSLTINNLATGADVASTRYVLKEIGFEWGDHGGRLSLSARQPGHQATSQAEPTLLECGNSGTTARLLSGFLTGERGHFSLIGDDSLSSRPMERIAAPLRSIGGEIMTTDGHLPIDIHGRGGCEGSDNIIDVTSAQVHAGLVLAGLRSRRGVRLRRTGPMRDHTLRLCSHLQFPITEVDGIDIVEPLTDTRRRTFQPTSLTLPGDFSSAAFLIAAALIVPGSDLTINQVSLNPTRTTFLTALERMGADIETQHSTDLWEPVGTIRVRYSPNLNGCDFTAANIAIDQMADELPLLAFLLSLADGPGRIVDASDLRTKEADRISVTVRILRSLGLPVEELEDGFATEGNARVKGGATINPAHDHRLAMLAAVAGLIAEEEIEIEGGDVVDVSWPGFWEVWAKWGER